MSTATTTKMLAAYEQVSNPLMFLSGLFQSPPSNFHTSEDVEIDVVRSDEEVATVITDLSTGYNMNSDDLYTNKKFKPPIFKEAIALNAADLIKRMPGQDPFQAPDFQANIIARMFRGMSKVERKIRVAIELQASQVMQTGAVTLTDNAGAALYTIDYKPKASHFPTAGTAWNLPASTKEADLNALAEVVRNDGLDDPDQIIMGVDAYTRFINDPAIQALLDNKRMNVGNIVPAEMRGGGGTFRGTIDLGHYQYDLWTYGGRYTHPVTGIKTQFIDPGKVIVRASGGRLDATFGAIPNIGKLLGANRSNMIPALPSRLSLADGSMDLHTNVWLSNDGEQMFGGVGARPLLIPTAIDTYGCLTTGA